MFTARLPPWRLDGNNTVSGPDAITRAQGGRAGGRGALLAVGQLLSKAALQWLLWQWWRVGDFVFQDAWEEVGRAPSQSRRTSVQRLSWGWMALSK